MQFNPIVIPIVVMGTGILLWAGYKAGQKNSIPVIGAVKPPPALPAATVGLSTTQEGEIESDLADALIQTAVAGAL